MLKKWKFLVFLVLLMASGSLLFSQAIRVKYKCEETKLSAQQIKFNFSIFNDTGVPVTLSELKIRYYYSRESNANEAFNIEYAAIGSSNINAEFFRGYVEISFKKDAGVIPNGGSCGEIIFRINTTDWSVYDQSNDHSFDPSKTSYVDYMKIVIFWGGGSVWGVEGWGEPILSNTAPKPSPSP